MAEIIDIKNLSHFREVFRHKKIGVTFSCWDLLHAGHHIFLEDIKKQCDILIVGLQTDPTIDRPNKNKPVQTLDEREIQLKSNRYVDFYFIYSVEESLYQSLKDLQPNIRFLGDDYIGKSFTGCDLPIKVIFHPRSEHKYSSTNLRQRIYDLEKNKQEIKQ
jgi:glycerol-3-phosphate cytidylyltransferase